MAIMTANCKITFSVAPEKTAEFKKVKCDKEILKKISIASVKLQKNMKDMTKEI